MMTARFRQLTQMTQLSKLEAIPPSVLEAALEDEIVTAIVRVREAGYVPEQVQVRTQIAPTLFTAELAAKSLDALETDPKVQSVALSRPQLLID